MYVHVCTCSYTKTLKDTVERQTDTVSHTNRDRQIDTHTHTHTQTETLVNKNL